MVPPKKLFRFENIDSADSGLIQAKSMPNKQPAKNNPKNP